METEIEKLTADLKTKKAELRTTTKGKLKADKAAAAKKAEVEKSKLLEAIDKSRKSIEEIMELQKNDITGQSNMI